MRGKTLVVTTSNGTRALLACQGAAAVLPGRAPPTSRSRRRRPARRSTADQRTLIVCAGREGGFSLDDAYCAGRLVAAVAGRYQAAPRAQRRGLAGLDLVRRYGDDWERPLRR